MDDKLAAAIATAPKKILIETVKLVQKEGRVGSKGTWKEFLNVHDRQLGSSLSDPARRSRETLASFLESFTDEENLKFIGCIVGKLSHRDELEYIIKESSDNDSPEQKLVAMTLEHPQYLLKYVFSFDDEEDWVATKVPKKSKLKDSNAMLSMDCEMVLCQDGTDALVRVCIVDRSLQVILDQKVNPFKPVADYRTKITGMAAEDLDTVTTSLEDVQRSIKKLLSRGAILVGHSLYNDLKALKLKHARVIDTTFLFKTRDGRTPSLNNLCKSILGYEVRKEGAPHNCLDDACAAMKLVLARIEKGVDAEFPFIEEDVKELPENGMRKLLLHNIPITVPIEELHGIFPGKFKLEAKQQKKGAKYSVFALFKNSEEAHKAFEKLNGILEKDTSGRLQKLVKLHIQEGGVASLYVRKMANDYFPPQVSMKRREIHDENPGDAKRLKPDEHDDLLKEIERLKQELREKQSDQCTAHLTEIERLKHELSTKDFQISIQDKIILDLKKKLEGMKTKQKKR